MKTTGNDLPLFSFTALAEANQFMEKQCIQKTLCPKLCGLFSAEGACFSYQVHQCLGACKGIEPPESYNSRAEEICKIGRFEHKNFLIFDRGRKNDENTVVKIENGLYRGFGYISSEYCRDIELLQDCIKSYPDNRDVHIIIQRYLRTKPALKIIPFGDEN